MEVQPEVNYVSRAELIKVVDGDTLRVDIDLGYTIRVRRDIRLSSVDTPEVRGPEREAGKYVAARVAEFLGPTPQLIIQSLRFSTGKYGRSLCRVWADGRCLNDWLLEERLGWPTDPSGRLKRVRLLSTLSLPDPFTRLNF